MDLVKKVLDSLTDDEAPAVPDYMPNLSKNPNPLCHAYTRDVVEAFFQQSSGQALTASQIAENFYTDGDACNVVWQAHRYKGTRRLSSAIDALGKKGIGLTPHAKERLGLK